MSILKKGFSSLVLAGLFLAIGISPVKAEEVASSLEGKMQLYVLSHPTVEEIKIKPDTCPVPGTVDKQIFIVASPGEYESASFVVRSLDNISLEIETGPLQGPKESIPSANIDVRSVKCWYQDRSGGWPGNAMKYTGDRVLTPELLLKDDSLVRVDKDKKENYVKLPGPDGEPRYICISQKGWAPNTEPFLIKDSTSLLPLKMVPDTNQQFWITLKIPEGAVPGIYSGQVKIRADGETSETLELKVRVLPIKLMEPYYTSSIYYIQPPSDLAQFKKEMQNLYAHGVTNPTFPFSFEEAFFGIGSSNYELKKNASFIGAIDEVKIYRRALNPAEILKSFQTPGAENVPDPSLAGYWKFDEGKGTEAKDATSFGNDGIIYGAGWIKGISGSALEFNATDEYVDCGNKAILCIANGSLTLECWIKTTETSDKRIISKRKDDSSWYSLEISQGKIGIETASFYPGNYTHKIGNTLINDGKWHQVVAVRNTDIKKVQLYVDGILDAEGADQTWGKILSSFRPEDLLEIRRAVGMNSANLYCTAIMTGMDSSDKKQLDLLEKEVARIVKLAGQYGIKNVYFYGTDEVKGEQLKSQRLTWQAIHKAGGKVFAAGFRERQYHNGSTQFELVGDLLDLFVCAGNPESEESQKWHSTGQEIACYGNPQGGVENPALYRRNFGLLLWRRQYDAAMTFAYQYGISWQGWAEFGNPSEYRPHMMVYPTIDGVVDTIQWEGYREGVDDVRYVTTLQNEIEKAKKSENPKKREEAGRAGKYLDDLDVENRNLDTIRLEVIKYILSLQEE